MSAPGPLAPFEVLLERGTGGAAPLGATLAALYGPLRFPDLAERGASGAWVIANLVTSLDGVVAFGDPASDPIPRGLGELSASDPHDRAVMGLLRAVADAVIVGASTLAAIPRHLWTPGAIAPAYVAEWAALRAALGKPPDPLAVIVSGSGAINTSLPVFQQPDTPALLVTSPAGAAGLASAALGPRARAVPAGDGAGPLSARAILDTILATLDALDAEDGRLLSGGRLVLVEGGPRLLGQFVVEGLLNEQFLTVAPQLAGRDETARRAGLIEGQRLIPARPTWARLVSARAAGDYLFLRYRLR